MPRQAIAGTKAKSLRTHHQPLSDRSKQQYAACNAWNQGQSAVIYSRRQLLFAIPAQIILTRAAPHPPHDHFIQLHIAFRTEHAEHATIRANLPLRCRAPSAVPRAWQAANADLRVGLTAHQSPNLPELISLPADSKSSSVSGVPVLLAMYSSPSSLRPTTAMLANSSSRRASTTRCT